MSYDPCKLCGAGHAVDNGFCDRCINEKTTELTDRTSLVESIMECGKAGIISASKPARSKPKKAARDGNRISAEEAAQRIAKHYGKSLSVLGD